jgi:excinuclease ABC subunit C
MFDRKFGAEFLARVPREPGIYRMYDAAGGLLYVGKARNLRRRLAQYRTARRTKKERKRCALVRSAHRIEWQACSSELEASLTEIGLIQALRPRRNVAGAFPFLYPFIGIQVDGGDTRFCLTTSPEAFAAFELHGASLRLLEYDGACARSADIHADLRAMERLFADEASTLAKAITATGYVGYPVPQWDRDALILRYRDVHSATTGGPSSRKSVGD